MGEREYYRIRTHARVGLRVVTGPEVEPARLRVRAAHVPPVIPAGSLDESRQSPEQRATLAVLQRIWIALERIDRRVASLAAGPGGEEPWLVAPDQPLAIGLSASGFAGDFALREPTGALFEATLDLSEAGLPPIPALARLARRFAHDGGQVVAFAFEEIHEADRERVVQLALRRQSEELRARESRDSQDGGGA
jgi:hypothetical protein